MPLNDSFILVDDVNPGVEGLSIRRGLPFLEHEGKYWGKPLNDDEAIRVLERMRRSGLRSSSSAAVRSGVSIIMLCLINIFVLNFNVSVRTSV